MDIFGFSRQYHLEQKWSIVASYMYPKASIHYFPCRLLDNLFFYFACHVIKILKNSSISGAGKLLSPAKKWLFCVGVATKWFELQWRWLKVRCNCGNVSRVEIIQVLVYSVWVHTSPQEARTGLKSWSSKTVNMGSGWRALSNSVPCTTVRLTQPCCPALPPRPRRILLRSPPPRSPIGAGLATHRPRTAFRPLRTATDCVVKVVEACYLKTPDPWVRVGLLGRVLVIVRSVVVVACRVGRCEILERAELGQVCPCFI